jgi:hypothetical protein
MKYPDLPPVPISAMPGLDVATERNVRRLVHALQMTVAEAVISLDLFETALGERAALAPPDWYEEAPEIDASLQPVRRALAAREPRPHIYYEAAPHMHARSFVLSLRMVSVYLQALAEEAAAELPELNTIAQGFTQALPGLKDLRDSIIHAEDRLRGLNRRGKPIVPEEVPGMAQGGGVFVFGLLRGRSLGWTLGDGSSAECEVSEKNLAIAVQATRDVMIALAP